MRIFLSYSSQDKNIADQIYLLLLSAGHDVFFDGAMIQGGDDFTKKIQEHIEECQLFIFLISPDSVTKPSYALTELKFARQKWPNPQSHVLPVVVRKTAAEMIPPYLRVVSMLEPEGNVAAEVAQQVADWQRRHGGSKRKIVAIVVSVLLCASLAAFAFFYVRRPNAKSPPPASSPQPVNGGSSPSPTPTSTPANTNNGRRPRPGIGEVLTNTNISQLGTKPLTVGVVLSSRVFYEQTPLKGARVSIVELPELGTELTNSDGAFSFKGVRRQLNETVRIRVEHDGFKTKISPVTIGKYLPWFYLEKVK